MSAKTRLGRLVKRLETEHEEGLTNAQLMLTNDDLKPGRISSFFFDFSYCNYLPYRPCLADMTRGGLLFLLDWLISGSWWMVVVVLLSTGV